MTGWTTHEGTAIGFDRESVDTDQIIPARFMSTPRSAGYGAFLLHDLRFDSDGHPRPAFPLNRHKDASVLIANRNFGSGSSREAAVYALVDFGFRAVLAPSFGDIFASNAVNNGLLPARVDAAIVNALLAELGDRSAVAEIDLNQATAKIGDRVLSFDLDPAWQHKLINGLDDIDLTLKRRDSIADHRRHIAAKEPWRLPANAVSRASRPHNQQSNGRGETPCN
ncbi:MAG: 3-isopropylmalate dehydratase small subunit [Pseudomonadota bacterium]